MSHVKIFRDAHPSFNVEPFVAQDCLCKNVFDSPQSIFRDGTKDEGSAELPGKYSSELRDAPHSYRLPLPPPLFTENKSWLHDFSVYSNCFIYYPPNIFAKSISKNTNIDANMFPIRDNMGNSLASLTSLHYIVAAS